MTWVPGPGTLDTTPPIKSPVNAAMAMSDERGRGWRRVWGGPPEQSIRIDLRKIGSLRKRTKKILTGEMRAGMFGQSIAGRGK